MAKKVKCPKCGSQSTKSEGISFEHARDYIRRENPEYTEEEIDLEFRDKLEREGYVAWYGLKRFWGKRFYRCQDCGNRWDRQRELDIEKERWWKLEEEE